MTTITNPIIPKKQFPAKLKAPHELHHKAICIFAATGFFLDQDTYFKDEVILRAATKNTIDDNGYLVASEPWFNWHYTPQNISFDEALDKFSSLFETIVNEQAGNKTVILPLSGGLDSRTQAVALKSLNKSVVSYSYKFKDGFDEVSIAKKIAKECGFEFHGFEIENGYLWDVIDELSKTLEGYSEFTHPRQMAITDFFKEIEGVFSLGHWGDVLFDKGGLETYKQDELTSVIIKKIIKKGGLELANQLWENWNLEGSFLNYLKSRITALLQEIEIDNPSAKLRAFKSLYWAPRWTTANLSVFEKNHPIALPYYDDRMCEFICTVPEEFLANRKLQIAYIKKHNTALAKLTWQDHRPFNLNTFKYNRSPFNLPYRIYNKLNRVLNSMLNRPLIQRNWELQFLGEANDAQLRDYIFSEDFNQLIPKTVVTSFYEKFKTVDQVNYSHPLSMILTFSLWSKNRHNG